jgi:hypothetical protein
MTKKLRPAIPRFCLAGLVFALCSASGADEFRPIPLRAEITGTQPMSGLVFWSTSEHRASPAISMEFSYLRYDEVVTTRGLYRLRVSCIC